MCSKRVLNVIQKKKKSETQLNIAEIVVSSKICFSTWNKIILQIIIWSDSFCASTIVITRI